MWSKAIEYISKSSTGSSDINAASFANGAAVTGVFILGSVFGFLLISYGKTVLKLSRPNQASSNVNSTDIDTASSTTTTEQDEGIAVLEGAMALFSTQLKKSTDWTIESCQLHFTRRNGLETLLARLSPRMRTHYVPFCVRRPPGLLTCHLGQHGANEVSPRQTKDLAYPKAHRISPQRNRSLLTRRGTTRRWKLSCQSADLRSSSRTLCCCSHQCSHHELSVHPPCGRLPERPQRLPERQVVRLLSSSKMLLFFFEQIEP